MRSEYVYAAWIVVIIAFVWHLNQPPSDLSWMYERDENYEASIRDVGKNYSNERETPLGIIGRDERVEFASFSPSDFPWSQMDEGDFAASAILGCNSSNGSASIVHRSDIAVFAAHQITDDDGTLRPEVQSCKLHIGSYYNRGLDIDWSTLKRGAFKVPKRWSSEFRTEITQEDWAVVRLKSPVNGITPYSLPPGDGSPFLPGAQVANVTSSTNNWPDEHYPGRLAQVCAYAGPYKSIAKNRVGRFDCDTGPGASGSGILAHDGGGGIYIAAILTDMNRGAPRCDRVGKTTCFTGAAMISPDIVQAVHELAGTTTAFKQ